MLSLLGSTPSSISRSRFTPVLYFFLACLLLDTGAESTLSLEKRVFNKLLSRSRMTIEEAWGELSSRFRFLRTDITWASHDWESEVSCAIYACMLLHNMCKEALDPAFPLEQQDYELIGQNVIDDANPAYAPAQDGAAVRDAIAVWASEQYTLGAGGVLVPR